jgi:hypothetical protein
MGPDYAPEYRAAYDESDPSSLEVSIEVQGFIIPASAVVPEPPDPPPTDSNGGGVVVPVPEDEAEPEPETPGEAEIPPKPADRPGGTWRWDEDLKQWIFDEDTPLMDMTLEETPPADTSLADGGGGRRAGQVSFASVRIGYGTPGGAPSAADDILYPAITIEPQGPAQPFTEERTPREGMSAFLGAALISAGGLMLLLSLLRLFLLWRRRRDEEAEETA